MLFLLRRRIFIKIVVIITRNILFVSISSARIARPRRAIVGIVINVGNVAVVFIFARAQRNANSAFAFAE